MTAHGVVAAASGTADRVHAVWQRYARRGDRGTARGRAYLAYLVALFALIYLVPVLYTASTSPAPVSVGSLTRTTPVVCALAAAACWGAQITGRFWGPLVIQPFVLHVFMSTDLSPTSYLGTIARRRLVYAGMGTLLSALTVAYLATDLFDQFDTALPGLAAALGLSAVAGVAWLCGQVRAVRDNLVLAAAAGAVALVVAVLSQTALDGAGGLWLAAGVLAAAAVTLGRTAFRSIRTVDLARLARESARASQAQVYAWTGTFHHALDLYRPEPGGHTSALLCPDGRLRGYLAQGAIRALRTPGRACAAVLFLLTGGAALTLGAAAAAAPEGSPGSSAALWLWVAGSVGVYLGSGWVSETWRGLRDELTLPPLFGERWGGTLARTLAWPVGAVTAGACLGGGAALLAPWPPEGGTLAETVLRGAGTVVLVLGARFLREMKLHMPLELLLPISTPLGDLSGLRVVVWQLDGLVAVVLGIVVLNAVPSALAATALATGLAACCVWTGLRRTGWAHRGLLTRLRRA